MYHLVKFTTKEPVVAENYIFTGPDSPWEVVMDLDEVRSKINLSFFRDAPPSASKYFPFMPIEKPAEFVSLKEGNTPLLKSAKIGRHLGVKLYFKLESQNPTGSFKDRGTALELTIAKELGVKGICVASTGNMAASCAGYAASAHIPCFIFVPEATPSSKLSQAISYGGRIVQVKGSYNDAAALAETVARELNFYLAGDYAFRVEGAKTAAFEVIDQLFYHPPAAVIVPMGCGTNIASYVKGFREYRALGLLETMPQLYGAQAEGAAPIINSFNKSIRTIEPVTNINTIASAIAIGNPLDGVKALDAIYSTGGEAYAATDREILEAQVSLAREEGLFIEASGAATLAVLKKLVCAGKLKGERVVCVLTGDGLKDPAPILKIGIKPPVIRPSIDEFLALYKNAFFEGNTVAFFDNNSVIFSETPTVEEIKNKIAQYSSAQFSQEQLHEFEKIINGFLMKGKSVTYADLQDIVQEVLKNISASGHRNFFVSDFTVTTSKDKKPTAEVEVKLNEKKFKGSADGVGPVDAVVNALRNACKEEIQFDLTNYSVAIRSQGTDAVVVVDIVLKRGDKTSVGQSSSPDVIQASIAAFERAYNGL